MQLIVLAGFVVLLLMLYPQYLLALCAELRKQMEIGKLHAVE